MLAAVGGFAVRWRRWVLVETVLAVVVAGALGGGVFDRLSGGGFSDPDAESSRARGRHAATPGNRAGPTNPPATNRDRGHG